MSWSTICANASIRVTPGSETLWSDHCGQLCWTWRFASSTRSWKVRSSRLGAVSAMSAASCDRGCRRLSLETVVLGDHVEREHQVAWLVDAADRVGDVDVEPSGLDVVEADPDVHEVDPGLPALEGHLDVVGDLPGGGRVRGSEHVLVDAAAALGAHGPVTWRGGQDEVD